MAKNITSVSWEASNIPSGLSFDTATGTFSGTPSGEGEYTVPVSVRTNYGTDTKDVNIKAVKAYPVYAIGGMAATWSENVEPDENGFRELNMPNAYKLLNHYGGFGAKVSGGDYYCCGVYQIIEGSYSPISSSLKSKNIPYKMQIGSDVFNGVITNDNALNLYGEIEEVRILYEKYEATYTTGGLASTVHDRFLMLVRMSKGYLLARASKARIYSTYSDGRSPNTIWTNLDDFAFQDSSCVLPEQFPPATPLADGKDIPLLIIDLGEKIVTQNYDASNASSGYHRQDLGYKAIKIFPSFEGTTTLSNKTYTSSRPPIFQYLSENKLLDNNASKFTLGNIRDVWVYMRKAYVVTEDNQLYEATATNNASIDKYIYEWILQGTFNVKKIVFSTANCVFMLTNDGKLYHKGSAIANVTDEHTDFTQLFSDCYFHDMTFYGTTLTVTKE